MPARLIPPLEEEFTLTKSDAALGNDKEGDDPTKVKIRQATQSAHDARMSLWAKFDKKFEIGDVDTNVTVSQSVSPAEVRKLEVFLTMIDCNLQDEKGERLFKFPLKKDEFSKAWGVLPPLVALEIHEKVLAVNPMWNVSGE